MWTRIKNAALVLVQADPRYRNETMESLNRWILATGYPGAAAPHEVTRDLIYSYAASLRNAGGPGPKFAPFAAMIAGAAQQFIRDNRIINPANAREFPVTLEQLARACYEFLGESGAQPLTTGGAVDYRAELLGMAEGEPTRAAAILPMLLASVVSFIDLLHRRYEGSAVGYHATFNQPKIAGQEADFIVAQFQEIADFPKVGVAVGLNFFKDSQVSGARANGLDLVQIRDNQIGWYVKPDMHVLRLMLSVTGKMEATGIALGDLWNLDIGVAVDIYSRCVGNYSLFLLRQECSKQERGQWNCIEEVHRFANRSSVAPLEIDRVLYLFGSGRYRDADDRLVVEQEERYRRFVDAVGGAAPNAAGDPTPGGGRGPNAAGPVEFSAGVPPRPPRAGRAQGLGEEPERTSGDLFYESIAGSQAAQSLIERVVALCSEVGHCEVHHTRTYGGDLRVRGLSASRPTGLNIVTMVWRSKKEYFYCEINLTVDDCGGLVLPASEIRTGPLETIILVTPPTDDEIFLALVRRSIARFLAQYP